MGVPLLLWALAAGASATAPDASAPPENPETIIVTGERAKRSLKETQSSVTVFDGATWSGWRRQTGSSRCCGSHDVRAF